MSPLHSIRVASLSAVAVFAALAFGACADSPTALRDTTVQQNWHAAVDSTRRRARIWLPPPRTHDWEIRRRP